MVIMDPSSFVYLGTQQELTEQQMVVEALAPATNIRVAETILMENLQRSGSAMKAVAWYHSADPSRGGAYFARFMTHFKQLDPATLTQ